MQGIGRVRCYPPDRAWLRRDCRRWPNRVERSVRGGSSADKFLNSTCSHALFMDRNELGAARRGRTRPARRAHADLPPSAQWAARIGGHRLRASEASDAPAAVRYEHPGKVVFFGLLLPADGPLLTQGTSRLVTP